MNIINRKCVERGRRWRQMAKDFQEAAKHEANMNRYHKAAELHCMSKTLTSCANELDLYVIHPKATQP